MTEPNIPVEKPLTPENRAVLQKLKDKAWFTLVKWYGSLFGAFIYLYYFVLPKFRYKPRTPLDTMTDKDYVHVFAIVCLFFGAIFLFFLIRDFRRMIVPASKDLKNDKKYCTVFFAKKYKDIFYNKCLLFYPGKEDVYIEIDQEDFDAIGNGEELYLETAHYTGEVLLLQAGEKIFKQASAFSYSEDIVITDRPGSSTDPEF